jgi:hypothetical protein
MGFSTGEGTKGRYALLRELWTREVEMRRLNSIPVADGIRTDEAVLASV